MAASIPPLPASLKSLQHYLKTAQEHEQKFPIVSYYCRMYALQKGMELDRTSPEAKAFLSHIMGQLEQMKAALGEDESLKSETVAQAYVEHYALKLFSHADTEDRAARHNKNVVKAFYNASLLFEVLTVFAPLNEDIEKYKKYARYKSAYINRCMKEGTAPVPGPVGAEGEDLDMGSLSVSDYMASRDQGETGTGPTSSPYGGTSSIPSPAASATMGGYQQPAAAQPPAASYQPPPSSGEGGDFPVDWEKAGRYTKFASSSLTYEDKDAAIDYLQKALNILTKGHE